MPSTPTVTGEAVYGATLTAVAPEPGVTYQWLRAGVPVAGAVAATYTPGLDDLGQVLAVQVTDATGSAVSAPTAPVARAIMTAKRQRVLGEARWTQTLKARPGRFSAPDAQVSWTWPDGSTARTYQIRPEDVGRRVVLRVRAEAPGYEPREVAVRSVEVEHRIGVRRTVRYRIETRGRLTTSLATFRKEAQETFDDPRGWRSAGIRFVPVAKGGAFSLVLAEASWLPRFSSGCSATWSCRVGRYVVINQERWKHASPAWNGAGLPLRSYRHMVVNHETGHWLGLGHSACPGPGRLAPVMQQQSKGLQGCRFNPFPTEREVASRTPRGRAMAHLAARAYAPDVE